MVANKKIKSTRRFLDMIADYREIKPIYARHYKETNSPDRAKALTVVETGFSISKVDKAVRYKF